MRPRDWFLVGIRLIGVWVFYECFNEILNLLLLVMDLLPQNYLDELYDGSRWTAAKSYVLQVIAYFALGLFFVAGGEGITKWAFGEYPREDDEEEEEAIT